MARHALAFSLILGIAFGGRAHAQQAAPASEAPHVSGGVGEEAREEMQRVAGVYDVHVLFADPAGAYIAGIDVVIRDRAGASYLSTVSDGPWLYVNLPPGSYEMTASFEGAPLTKTFTVPARGTRQLVFRWPAQ